MYQHILLAVALQQWDEFSPHAVAAREAGVALAHGSGAQLSVLSVYDYDDDQPDALSLPLEDVSRDRETQITPLLKVGHPRQLIVATAEALGVDCLVIGAHSKRSFLDVLLGGTATAVSRHAPCAVVMVQPGEKRPLVQTSEVDQTQ